MLRQLDVPLCVTKAVRKVEGRTIVDEACHRLRYSLHLTDATSQSGPMEFQKGTPESAACCHQNGVK